MTQQQDPAAKAVRTAFRHLAPTLLKFGLVVGRQDCVILAQAALLEEADYIHLLLPEDESPTEVDVILISERFSDLLHEALAIPEEDEVVGWPSSTISKTKLVSSMAALHESANFHVQLNPIIEMHLSVLRIVKTETDIMFMSHCRDVEGETK